MHKNTSISELKTFLAVMVQYQNERSYPPLNMTVKGNDSMDIEHHVNLINKFGNSSISFTFENFISNNSSRFRNVIDERNVNPDTNPFCYAYLKYWASKP